MIGSVFQVKVTRTISFNIYDATDEAKQRHHNARWNERKLFLQSSNVFSGGSTVGDPHAYFSRPGSSQSLHGGRGGPTTDRERKQDEEFRAKLAAMQADDDSPPTGRKLGVPSQGIVCR